MLIELLVTQGCQSSEETYRLVAERARILVPAAELKVVQLEADQVDTRAGFYGSPTIRIDGVDLERRQGPPTGAT